MPKAAFEICDGTGSLTLRQAANNTPGVMNKKRIAREWLLFLGCFFFVFLVGPFLLFLFLARGNGKLSDVYSTLVE